MVLDGFVDISVVLRCGVYALLHRGAVVYIGQSKVMLTRVYSHRNAWGKKSTPSRPRGVSFDGVWVRPCRLEEVDGIEIQMIAKYKPRYNIHHNNGLPPDIAALISQLCTLPPPTPIAMPRTYRR